MDIRENLAQIGEELRKELDGADALQSLEQLRVKVLGKKGSLTALLRGMGSLSPEERPKMGQMINEAREKLTIMQMSREEQRAYDSYWMDRHILENTMTTARGEGKQEGYEEGKALGMAQGREEGMAQGMAQGAREKALEIARRMKEQGLSAADIIGITGLTADELSAIS